MPEELKPRDNMISLLTHADFYSRMFENIVPELLGCYYAGKNDTLKDGSEGLFKAIEKLGIQNACKKAACLMMDEVCRNLTDADKSREHLDVLKEHGMEAFDSMTEERMDDIKNDVYFQLMQEAGIDTTVNIEKLETADFGGIGDE